MALLASHLRSSLTRRSFAAVCATRPFSSAFNVLHQSASTQSTSTHSPATDPNQNSNEGTTLKHFAFKQGTHPLDTVQAVKQLNLARPSKKSYMLYEPAYTPEELNNVSFTHLEPSKLEDKLSYFAIKVIRSIFDTFTGYNFINFNETLWLRRIIFLETIAGVPGMVAGMVRHLRSLRRMKRDHGWIHTLLGEAENERMHLLTFLTLKQPGILFRSIVIIAQGVFFNVFFVAYLLFPAACHRFVGYLEEEAVKTYTICIKDLDHGKLPVWSVTPAPEIARNYWHLKEGAMLRDVLLAVRADEANHRDVNHTFSSLKADENNPFEK